MEAPAGRWPRVFGGRREMKRPENQNELGTGGGLLKETAVWHRLPGA